MELPQLFKSFFRGPTQQPRHTKGLPSKAGRASTALRWISGMARACHTCGGPLVEKGGPYTMVRFCSKVCRLQRHNRNGRRVQRLVRRVV